MQVMDNRFLAVFLVILGRAAPTPPPPLRPLGSVRLWIRIRLGLSLWGCDFRWPSSEFPSARDQVE